MTSSIRLFSTKSLGRIAIAIRLVMLLSLWSGPIPLGHDHRVMMNGTLGSASVSKHIASHHSTCDCGSTIALGWHLHWIMPKCENNGFEDCAGAIESVHAKISKTPSIHERLIVHGSSVEPDCWLLPTVSLEPIHAAGFPVPTLATCKLSLPELLGVMRC